MVSHSVIFICLDSFRDDSLVPICVSSYDLNYPSIRLSPISRSRLGTYENAAGPG